MIMETMIMDLRMSTHPYSDHNDDLDRTDELPRLDVAAYEASLAAAGNDTLVSTDAWAVEALRDADATTQDTAEFPRFDRARSVAPEPPKSDVTLDATRILSRLAQLEAELATAKGQEGELAARLERLTSDYALKDKEARALSVDNSRLTEQRSLAHERMRVLEQQLKDDAVRFEHDMALQRDARSTETHAEAQVRLGLEQHAAELRSLVARLSEERHRLDEETQAAAKLAKTQSELVEQFKQRLHAEEKNAAQLARHLAAKIAQHAAVGHEIERRDATILALQAAQHELTTQLEERSASAHALSDQLADLAQQLASKEDELREHATTAAQREGHIGQLTDELQAARANIDALCADRDATARTLAAEREAQSAAQQSLSARAQEIDALQGSTESLQQRIAVLQDNLAQSQGASAAQHDKIQALERALSESQLRREILTSDFESTRTRLQQLESEANLSASIRDALSAKSGELQHLKDALAGVQRELDEVRANLVVKHSELTEREEALRAAHEIIADLRKMNDDLHEASQQTQRRCDELTQNEREREESVLANAAGLAAARRQLSQQFAAVQSMESALRGRDTLTERLRGELQISHDERAIIAGQLENSRTRNKAMAREIFARDNQIAALKAELAVHAETLAAIRQDVNRATMTVDLPADVQRILEPVEHDGAAIVLDRKLMTIGRTGENDICIPSKLVSRRHARLLIGPNAVILEDAGSTNGCFVNEVQVKQQLMRDGDVLSIGELRYRLRTAADNATRARANVIPFGDGR